MARAKMERDGAGESARVRILNTAEAVFAEVGFDAASLRQIAVAAGVPVALVSYHYDGKLGLYREVFRARYPRVVEQRRAGLALAAMEPDLDRRLEMLLRAVLAPMLTLRGGDGTSDIGVLLAREASDPKAPERGIIAEIFDGLAQATIAAMRDCLPGRSETEIGWAYQMIIGTMIYVMADSGRASALSAGASNPKDIDATLKTIVALLLNGVAGAKA
jgi:AcrR family transcriptional regulator